MACLPCYAHTHRTVHTNPNALITGDLWDRQPTRTVAGTTRRLLPDALFSVPSRLSAQLQPYFGAVGAESALGPAASANDLIASLPTTAPYPRPGPFHKHRNPTMDTPLLSSDNSCGAIVDGPHL